MQPKHPPLISADELSRLLQQSEHAQVPPLVLLDARPSATAFAEEHLPGARHADLEAHLSTAGSARHEPARGGRHPLPTRRDFSERLGLWGVTPRTRVIVYDASAGDMAAARCWWMLRAGGHRADLVQVLDGGLDAARAEGLLLASRSAPVPAPTRVYPLADWSGHLVDLDFVQEISQGAGSTAADAPSNATLLDARSASRFRGEGDPFDPVTGHIPGSLNAPYLEALEQDGTFREATEVRNWLLERLDDEARAGDVVVTCGSGVTACHLALAMEHAGLPLPRIYVGSWSEWCRHSELPVARGEATDETDVAPRPDAED